MNWIILTFFAIISRSAFGVMLKVFSNRSSSSAYTQSVTLAFYASVITLLLSPFLGGINFDYSQIDKLPIFLAVVSQGFGNVLFFAGISKLSNSTTQIAFSSVLLFNTILSVLFLNLNLSFTNYLGLLLLLIAILIAVSGKLSYSKKGIFLIVLAAFSFAVFGIASTELSQMTTAPTYLLISYLGATISVFAFKHRIVIKDLKKKNKIFAISVATATPSVATFLFSYYAYRAAPEPSRVLLISTGHVVLTVFVSYFLFKEEGSLWKKIVAALLVIAAAILIKS
jgi:drug/metabolite transporter (DMT)-like permease